MHKDGGRGVDNGHVLPHNEIQCAVWRCCVLELCIFLVGSGFFSWDFYDCFIASYS